MMDMTMSIVRIPSDASAKEAPKGAHCLQPPLCVEFDDAGANTEASTSPTRAPVSATHATGSLLKNALYKSSSKSERSGVVDDSPSKPSDYDLIEDSMNSCVSDSHILLDELDGLVHRCGPSG